MAEVITRFKLETTQFDSKLRDSAKSLSELTGKLMFAGKDFDRFASKNVEAARALGSIQSGATNAKDKVRDLVGAFNDVAKAYNNLTKEQQQSDFGKALAGSLGQLKGRITDAKKELYDVGGALKSAGTNGIDWQNVLQGISGQLGVNTKLLGVLTTGTMGYAAAIVGVSTAAIAATKALIDYNTELNRQTNITTVTTGLTGADADQLTAGVRALSRTYDVDFREAINAANTLIQQFGLSGQEALGLLEDGMQGMILGDGSKLLSMIQQYAPSFRDAGISASQLVAIIQNSEGGLFTDENMNAIVMGIRNIRLMTKNTSDALKQLGIDGEEMSRKLDSGSMTVFDALREVSDKIDEVGSGSKAAGEVMQSVFGRQGTAAGTKLGEAIATLNLNLEETRLQTGELGVSYAQLQEANRRLDSAMVELFGHAAGWDEMSNAIKTGALNAVSELIEDVTRLKNAIDGLDGSAKSFETIGSAIDNSIITKLSTALFLTTQLKKLLDGMRNDQGKDSTPSGGKGSTTPKDGTYYETTDKNGSIVSAGYYYGGKQYKTTGPEVVVTPGSNDPSSTKKTKSVRTARKAPAWVAIEMQDMGMVPLGRSEADISRELSRAQKGYKEAGDIFTQAGYASVIDRLQQEQATRKGQVEMINNPFADAYSHDFTKDLEKYNKSKEKEDNKEEDKKVVSIGEKIGDMAGGIQQMVGGLEQLGIDIPAGLQSVVGGIQAVSSILSGIMTVVSVIRAISAADALIPGWAGGGVVRAAGGTVIPGNYMSGDRLRMPIIGGGVAAVNSQEVILNRAQQGNLVSQLEGGNMRNLRLETYVSGRELAIVLNNETESHGRGRYVTSNRRTT